MVSANRKLLNSSGIKKMALGLSEATRAGKFTRVSNDFLDRIADRLAVIVREEVAAHPSLGKTLK
jgi:hypothetical protein